MPKVLRVLLVIGLGIAAIFSARTASAALGDLGSDDGPADSFWLGSPGFGHHPPEWWASGVSYGHRSGTPTGLANPFIPPPARIFLETSRGGFYGTLLQTVRFGVMNNGPGSSISMMSTPILFAPDGEPILYSTQARWITSGPGQLVFLDPRFNHSWVGSSPGPQGGGGGPRLSSFGGPVGSGGIGGGGGGGVRRTASTTNDPGSTNDLSQTGEQTPIIVRTPQITSVDAPTPVPLPGAFVLFGSGLAALFVAGRKKKS